MKSWWIMRFVSILSLLFGAFCSISYGQDSLTELKSEVETLKRGQDAIRVDLQTIKSLLSQRQSLPNSRELNVRDLEFELGNNPVRGNAAAKLILVDFTDYQCPYCGRYTRETFPQIIKTYVDSGKIRYAVVDVPLPIHKMAPKAAEAALCAKEQGKFWEMHEQMMSKQESLDSPQLYASSLNLDLSRFEECIKTGKYSDQVSRDLSLAAKLGISGVPGFVIALSDTAYPLKVKGIDAIRGAQPFSSFQKVIDEALAHLSK